MLFILVIPHYSEYFDELITHRLLIQNLIIESLTNKIQEDIKKLNTIDVAVHVRVGDFQKLKEDTDFKTVVATRTPFEYFINVIKKVNRENPDYIFHIFSDGFPEELQPITV